MNNDTETQATQEVTETPRVAVTDDGTIEIHHTITSGEELHAFFDGLTKLGRKLFGVGHSGLYTETIEPLAAPEPEAEPAAEDAKPTE